MRGDCFPRNDGYRFVFFPANIFFFSTYFSSLYSLSFVSLFIPHCYCYYLLLIRDPDERASR